MKRVKLRIRLMLLAICSLLSLTACKSKNNKVEESESSSFVVTDVHTTDNQALITNDKEQASEDDSLNTFSSNDSRTEAYNKEQQEESEPEEDKEEESEMTASEQVKESTKDQALSNLGSLLEPDASEMVDDIVVENIKAMPAESKVLVYEANAATLAACFYAEEIQPSVYMRMENKSFGEECTTSLESLRYVRVLHFGFDGEIYIGELVVNQLIADDIIDIFKELFDARYPIERMVLVDNYDADDNLSMAANNTSCFNYRVVDGTSKLSNHAYGLAIDINPLYNPYVRTIDGEEVILPENGTEYADRSQDNPYYVIKGDVCYNAFIKRGFTWGGNWEDSKDYQHFQKVFE